MARVGGGIHPPLAGGRDDRCDRPGATHPQRHGRGRKSRELTGVVHLAFPEVFERRGLDERPGEAEPMRPMTVLVVEDQEEVRAVIVELLSLHGYHVLTAGSLPEAEAVRARLGLAALGLVITNLRLTRAPEAHEGIDLILRWHAVEPSLPFILMSGDLRSPQMAKLPVKAVWYLSKPFALEVFLDIVREATRA
jgi:CheY-like chemotaxis protein